MDHEIIEESEKLASFFSNAFETIRDISHQLHPKIIELLGLGTALQVLLDSFGESNEIQVKHEISERIVNFDPRFSLNIYRIVQESLINISKHSQASRLGFRFIHKEHQLELTIKDNGIGFNQESKTNGIGLFNISERTKEWNGNLEIKSGKNKGTTLLMTFPLESILEQEI